MCCFVLRNAFARSTLVYIYPIKSSITFLLNCVGFQMKLMCSSEESSICKSSRYKHLVIAARTGDSVHDVTVVSGIYDHVVREAGVGSLGSGIEIREEWRHGRWVHGLVCQAIKLRGL